MNEAPDSIYELVDSSDEERYFTLGLFLTEEAALDHLRLDYPPYHDDRPDSVTLEVRRRPVGFHPHEWSVVASRMWVRNYDDELPEWSSRPILRPQRLLSP